MEGSSRLHHKSQPFSVGNLLLLQIFRHLPHTQILIGNHLTLPVKLSNTAKDTNNSNSTIHMLESLINKQWEHWLATATISIYGGIKTLLLLISNKIMPSNKIMAIIHPINFKMDLRSTNSVKLNSRSNPALINQVSVKMGLPLTSRGNSVLLNSNRLNPTSPSINKAYSSSNNNSSNGNSNSNSNNNLRQGAELISPISVLSC